MTKKEMSLLAQTTVVILFDSVKNVLLEKWIFMVVGREHYWVPVDMKSNLWEQTEMLTDLLNNTNIW